MTKHRLQKSKILQSKNCCISESHLKKKGVRSLIVYAFLYSSWNFYWSSEKLLESFLTSKLCLNSPLFHLIALLRKSGSCSNAYNREKTQEIVRPISLTFLHLFFCQSSVSSCESGIHFEHLLMHMQNPFSVKAPGQEFFLSTSSSKALYQEHPFEVGLKT